MKEWFGFGRQDALSFETSAAHAGQQGSHGHTHGVIDPSLSSSERGVWAIKWSFAILAVTSILQLVVVFYTGSVALLADTIHNVGDAVTAVPLWIAFVLVRRKATASFNYGLGRVEDFAGLVIVFIILVSALIAGYEAIDRLIHPQPVTQLLAVAIAGIVGFIGNEAVAIFRIRVGREMNSTALIADGYHARTDGLTSLAVVLGAAGVWLGFPLADPIVGLLITLTIFGIVWQSAKAVIKRSLDGIQPEVTAEIRHAAEHVAGVRGVTDVKARWLGHKLRAEITVAVDNSLSVGAANEIAGNLKSELAAHIPPLSAATVIFDADGPGDAMPAAPAGHHAPEPFAFDCAFGAGTIAIVDTDLGERMRLSLTKPDSEIRAVVHIFRGSTTEILPLLRSKDDARIYESQSAPAEPHEFEANLELKAAGDRTATVPFHMSEPVGHHH
ncbi:cation diffusion facilitator family transporter [Dongia sp.]|uniref:cation diffusion facilitator family transporter n=1 Tax=Dongia sp. TaxID=1977262 RepID=UPI00374FDDEF